MVARAVFETGKQKRFISSVCGGLSLRAFVGKYGNGLGVSYSAFKKYNSEALTLPQPLFEGLCRIGRVNPAKIKVKMEEDHWGAAKGGKRGINSLMERYGKGKLREWRSKGGRASNGGGNKLSGVTIPNAIDERLAEFIGACLGDGTITKYFIRIFADKRYAISYLEHLYSIAEEKFGVTPTIRIPDKRNIAYLEIRSKKVCGYFRDALNIPPGNKIKNRVRIPGGILADRGLRKACLRGLIDTDGSVSKRGGYMCLAFDSRNPGLLGQVNELGRGLGVFTYRYGGQVGTNSWPKIRKYFREVGSSSPAHIIRYVKRGEEGRFLYKRDVLKYLTDYKKYRIPFMGP